MRLWSRLGDPTVYTRKDWLYNADYSVLTNSHLRSTL